MKIPETIQAITIGPMVLKICDTLPMDDIQVVAVRGTGFAIVSGTFVELWRMSSIHNSEDHRPTLTQLVAHSIHM
jgi:hypothetical protein